MGPVLGNLDPYSGTLNLTRICLCTQVLKYNTLNWLNIDGLMQVQKKCQVQFRWQKNLVYSFYYILYQTKGVPSPSHNFSGTSGTF